MAYLSNIDFDKRIIDFAVFTTASEKLDMVQEPFEEGEDGEITKKRITKLTMIRSFLKENNDFFTVKDVSEMLKLNRKTVEKFLISGDLESFRINYYFAPGGDRNPSFWEPLKESNLKMVIHSKDLKTFLNKIIDSSFWVISGDTIVNVEDDFKRKSPLLKDKPPVVFLQHKRTSEQLNVLLDQIISGEVVLHSKNSLQQLVEKSDTSFTRLMKTVDTVRLNWGGTRDTTRMVFDNLLVKEEAAGRIRKFSMSPVTIIPVVLEESDFDVKEFSDPVDYVSLVQDGFTGPPEGIFVAGNGLSYFSVERDNSKGLGVEIIPFLELEKEEFKKSINK